MRKEDEQVAEEGSSCATFIIFLWIIGLASVVLMEFNMRDVTMGFALLHAYFS